MSLDDLVEEKSGGNTLKDRIERLHKNELCPNCGSESEKLRGNEYRCTKDNCEVLTYLTTDYELNK